MITRTALLGAWAVALGAFGAHGLRTTLDTLGTAEQWHTAVLYHLVHTATLLALGIWMRTQSEAAASGALRLAHACWTAGILLFSGSLYALALGAPSRWLWPVTPLGGLCFLLGWLSLSVGAYRLGRHRPEPR